MIRQSGLFFVVAFALAMAGPASVRLGADASARQAAVPAQQPAAGNTVGTVVDISGAVIPGAEVIVTSRDGRSSTVMTERDGTFDAGVIAARVRVASEGFEPVTIDVNGGDPV